MATWQSLSLQKKIISALAVCATILMFVFLFRQTTKPQMALLYSGIDAASAGEVISELESLGVVYQVRGETIYTDARRRDMLRLELAAQDLPRQSVAGYELLDNLNSFAMTSEMFNTAYWRAKEGELTRTILSLPSVKVVRVHIGTAKQSSFSRTPVAKSASVTITAVNRFDPKQAKAVQYLTALAVSGLAPNDVAVIDSSYGLVAGPGLDNEVMGGGMNTPDRATRLEKSLLSMLEARVGMGNARVTVFMEVDRQRQVTSEVVFDPDSRVIKKRSNSESSRSSNGSGGAAVTVASNLPEGDAGQGSSLTSDDTETSEQTEYEISEIRRDSETMPGTLTRQTIAVLLNDIVTTNADGTTTTAPRSEAELATLRELIAAAAGITEDRGDVLTIKSLAFNALPEVGTVSAPGLWQQFVDNYLWSTLQALILAAVVLVLALFVIKPLLSRQEGPAELPLQIAADDDLGFDPGGFEMAQVQVEEDPVDVMRGLTAEKPDDAATLLMSWLEEEGKVAP